MGFQCWRRKWSPLKRNPGGSQVCVCVANTLSKCVTAPLGMFSISQLCMSVCVGADLSDYFNYGFNEDTWKAYCEKQKRLRMGLEVSTVGSVTSKITVRYECLLFL